MKNKLAIAIATGIQERICRAIYPALSKSVRIGHPEIISLEGYYRLGLGYAGFEHVRIFRDRLTQPWYDRSRALKLLSLGPYLWQIYLTSLRARHFLFFVDTGVLERSAIILLKALGCKVAVLQDAMKRRPNVGSQHSLTWFGGGGANLYLLMGERYRSMVWSNKAIEIVGSPIYSNSIDPLPLGKNILVVNQCFAKYGEVAPDVEFNFIDRVIGDAIRFGPVELRLHPHNDSHRYRKLASFQVRVTQRRPLMQSLSEAGIVLSINSTVILEALALGRPVLTLAWHPSPFNQPVDDVVTRCSNHKEMCTALERWKNDRQSLIITPDKLRGTMNSFIACEGDASIERISTVLESFVSASGTLGAI